MKSRVLLIAALIFLFLTNFTVSGQNNASGRKGQKEVAVTFDDLPFVTRQEEPPLREMTARLLKSVTSNKIPAIGFVNENKLLIDGQQDTGRVALLRMWLDAGLELGNHSYSHPDLHNTPLAAFQEDVIRGETVTKELLKAKGKALRYFRHPFLHTGRDLETKHKFEEFLAGRGYRVAPVTIDNSEWIFARAYDNAAISKDAPMMKRIGGEYVAYMERKFDYFERQSVKLFGYEIKQTLLLHANALNADHFGELARMMKRRGYRFITLDEALTDKAYTSPDTFTGPGGITWLHRWAITMGGKGSILADEPRTADFVLKQAGVTSE